MTWEELEALAGISIPPVVRTFTPTTDKLLVVLEVPPEMTEGGIVKTQQSREAEMGGSGWVVRVGPQCGFQILQAAVYPIEMDPIGLQMDLLAPAVFGRHVCWSRYGGDTFIVTDRDDEFKSRFRILKEEHVVGVLGPTNNQPGEPK